MALKDLKLLNNIQMKIAKIRILMFSAKIISSKVVVLELEAYICNITIWFIVSLFRFYASRNQETVGVRRLPGFNTKKY